MFHDFPFLVISGTDRQSATVQYVMRLYWSSRIKNIRATLATLLYSVVGTNNVFW